MILISIPIYSPRCSAYLSQPLQLVQSGLWQYLATALGPVQVSVPDMRLAKYSTQDRFSLQSCIDPESALGLKACDQNYNTICAFSNLLRASVAKSTWQKYESAWRAFLKFSAETGATTSWPLPLSTIRAFATWCLSSKNLQPSTTGNYISALKFMHKLKGCQAADTEKDPVLTLILAGAKNLSASHEAVKLPRRVVTFPLLLTIGHRLANLAWDKLSTQVLWSVATLAFFTSARLGELLACRESSHDPTSDLTWDDVHFRDDSSVLIRLKAPKSGDPAGEFLDVFRFPGYNCCPVTCLSALYHKQQAAGLPMGATPVFRF